MNLLRRDVAEAWLSMVVYMAQSEHCSRGSCPYKCYVLECIFVFLKKK